MIVPPVCVLKGLSTLLCTRKLGRKMRGGISVIVATTRDHWGKMSRDLHESCLLPVKGQLKPQTHISQMKITVTHKIKKRRPQHDLMLVRSSSVLQFQKCWLKGFILIPRGSLGLNFDTGRIRNSTEWCKFTAGNWGQLYWAHQCRHAHHVQNYHQQKAVVVLHHARRFSIWTIAVRWDGKVTFNLLR